MYFYFLKIRKVCYKLVFGANTWRDKVRSSANLWLLASCAVPVDQRLVHLGELVSVLIFLEILLHVICNILAEPCLNIINHGLPSLAVYTMAWLHTCQASLTVKLKIQTRSIHITLSFFFRFYIIWASFLSRWVQAPSPEKVMREKLDGVEESCSGDLVTTVSSKVSHREWIFTLHTCRLLRVVALLQDAHRNHFFIR